MKTAKTQQSTCNKTAKYLQKDSKVRQTTNEILIREKPQTEMWNTKSEIPQSEIEISIGKTEIRITEIKKLKSV